MKKNRVVRNQIRTISCSEKEITDKKEINSEILKFYKALFEPKISVSQCFNSGLFKSYCNSETD